MTVLPIPLAGIADNLYRPGREDSRLSWLLAPHPLQVRAGRNQLQPLLVTMPHGELLHAWRWNSTSGAAPHAVRAWRCALLHLQVRELSDEASIFAVLRLKPLNLFLTLLPMHSFSLGGLVQSWGSHVSTMSPMASLADRYRLRAKSRKARANVVRFAPHSGHKRAAPPLPSCAKRPHWSAGGIWRARSRLRVLKRDFLYPDGQGDPGGQYQAHPLTDSSRGGINGN